MYYVTEGFIALMVIGGFLLGPWLYTIYFISKKLYNVWRKWQPRYPFANQADETQEDLRFGTALIPPVLVFAVIWSVSMWFSLFVAKKPADECMENSTTANPVASRASLDTPMETRVDGGALDHQATAADNMKILYILYVAAFAPALVVGWIAARKVARAWNIWFWAPRENGQLLRSHRSDLIYTTLSGLSITLLLQAASGVLTWQFIVNRKISQESLPTPESQAGGVNTVGVALTGFWVLLYLALIPLNGMALYHSVTSAGKV